MNKPNIFNILNERVFNNSSENVAVESFPKTDDREANVPDAIAQSIKWYVIISDTSTQCVLVYVY